MKQPLWIARHSIERRHTVAVTRLAAVRFANTAHGSQQNATLC